MVDLPVTTKQQTWFKKQPLDADLLSNTEKAKVYQGRTYPAKRILEQKDSHTLLSFGVLGDWWIENAHWLGLTPEIINHPYAEQDGFIYLQDFPYFCLEDVTNVKTSLDYCLAMWLRYLGEPAIQSALDYIDFLPTEEGFFFKERRRMALSKLGWNIKFSLSIDELDIQDEIKNGRPVIANIFYNGTYTAPTYADHYVVVTGYSEDQWLIHDPIGELDTANGCWKSVGGEAGKNNRHLFKFFNPRLFFSGCATGHCWSRLSKMEP